MDKRKLIVGEISIPVFGTPTMAKIVGDNTNNGGNKKVPVRLLLFNAKGGIVGDNTNGSKQNVVGEEHQPRWNIVGDNINNGGNDGKMEDKILDNVMVGENIYQRKIPHLDKGGAFMLTIETPNEKATQKIIVAP